MAIFISGHDPCNLMKRNRQITGGILLALLLLDLGYSFYQHYHMPLGGDLGQNILPTPESGYYKVLEDPLGLNVLMRDEIYSNPNRFFAHLTASAYFRNVPLFLQRFTEPINSIYLSAAIIKIFIQSLILYLLAAYISGTVNVSRLEFLIAAVLVTPLFQTSGYNRYMGIIDQSAIYAIFYALPLGLLLLFFLPFYKNYRREGKPAPGITVKILLALLIPVLSLNGPLVPGVVLIVCPLVLLIMWIGNYRQTEMVPGLQRMLYSAKKIPGFYWFYFATISFFCLYSLYIGRNNALNISGSVPLLERYSRLPEGIYRVLTSKLGFPLLLLAIITNLIIIRKHYRSEETGRIINMVRWTGVFSLIFILLLPLGGYRFYRENIIRYDTIMPVTIGIIFVFGLTTFYLIRNIAGRYRTAYFAGVVLLLLIFTNSDRLDTKGYECERNALQTIAHSPDKIVRINTDCPVMDWNILSDPALRELDGDLLYYWNVTDEKKLFFQEVIR
jgi:hypothetical protein